jgi:DNA invertase Pin-like site-specific DNA recombinase
MDQESIRERRAVLYLRVANLDEDSKQAVAAQRVACHRIAVQRGLTVIREYADLGRPARLERQPQLRRLLTELAAHRDAAFVVVWDYTRLSRDLAELDDIIYRIRTCNAEVITLTGVEASRTVHPTRRRN